MKTAAIALVLALGTLVGGAALAQPGITSQAPYPVAERAGLVQSVSAGAQELIVDGYRYFVAVDVQVELGGSYGAYTMVEPGMRIYFEYLVVSPSERWIIRIRELPDNVDLEAT